MREISPGRLHLSVAEAQCLAEGALRGIGYDADDARVIADHVIDAAVCGYEYSGLAKILNIPNDRRFKRGAQPMKMVRETPVSILFDGGNTNGMITLFHATRAAIAKAQAMGFALVGVGNTSMSGRSAYYMEMIANAGLIGLLTVSASRGVAPPGGTKAVLGTNPIAFGMPTDAGPFVFDIGTSAIMGTDVMLRQRLGQSLPPGVALDADGNETLDPAKAKGGGALLPFAGHKGFGLGLVAQMLGVLAGAGMDIDRDNASLLVVFKPDLLTPLEDFKAHAAELIARVKAIPRQAGVEEIRIPGERSFRNRERLSKEGIEIDRLVFDSLTKLAG